MNDLLLKRLFFAGEVRQAAARRAYLLEPGQSKMTLCFQTITSDLWGPDQYLGGENYAKDYAASAEQIPTKLEEKKLQLKKPRITREALKPFRIFSFNHRVPIINLSSGKCFRIFFVSGHLGVIFDVKINEQHILRGHVGCRLLKTLKTALFDKLMRFQA